MEKHCRADSCVRPVYSDGLCYSHHANGESHEVRTYTPRTEGRVTHIGLRLLPPVVERLTEAQKVSGLSARGAVAEVVTHWSVGKVWRPSRRGGPSTPTGPGRSWKARMRRTVAAAGLAVVAACVSDMPARMGVPDVELSKPMPDRPLPGQVRPPCEEPLEAISGGCWAAAIDRKTKSQRHGCIDSENLYEDKEGFCWVAAYPKPKPKVPNAVEK